MGIWLAAEISLNRKLDNSRRLVCDVTGFWQCKAVGAKNERGVQMRLFGPTDAHSPKRGGLDR